MRSVTVICCSANMVCFRQVVSRLTGHSESFYRSCTTKTPRDLRKLTRMFSTTSGQRQKLGQPVSKARQHPVGVIGAGRVASSVHIPNILRNHRLQLRWIVENNPDATKTLQDKLYLDVPCYTSEHTGSLLDDESLSAVFVFTPTPTHYDIILSSLQKGKAVFTEKPTAETLTEISTLYDTAARLERPLLTGYMRRFDPAFQDIYDMLVQGQLGKLHISKITTRDSPKPSYELLRNMDRTGCNILSDLAVHDFDFMTWIMQGAAPESIYVVTHAHDPVMAEIGQPDVSTVIMKYPDGSVAILDTTRESCYGYDNRVELFGSRGMATSENPRQSFATKNFDSGALQKPMMHSFPQRYREAFQNEIDHFVDCMEGKASPFVTKEDCLLTGLMVEAAVESYKQNQAISFPEFLSHRASSISRHQAG